MPHSQPPMSDIILTSSQSAVTRQWGWRGRCLQKQRKPKGSVVLNKMRGPPFHFRNEHSFLNKSLMISFLGRLDFYNGREKNIRYKFSDTRHEETFILFFWIYNLPPTIFLGKELLTSTLTISREWLLHEVTLMFATTFVFCSLPIFHEHTDIFNKYIFNKYGKLISIRHYSKLWNTVESILRVISLSRVLQKYGIWYTSPHLPFLT